tara:strand:+ start:406 stop:630 length:225 start_codon:yes stop_codon:yes gene_type:complete
MTKRQIVNVADGTTDIVDYTAEEETALENRKVELAKEPTMEEKITAKEDLKASAKAKLVAGEALTEDEANTIVL